MFHKQHLRASRRAVQLCTCASKASVHEFELVAGDGGERCDDDFACHRSPTPAAARRRIVNRPDDPCGGVSLAEWRGDAGYDVAWRAASDAHHRHAYRKPYDSHAHTDSVLGVQLRL